MSGTPSTPELLRAAFALELQRARAIVDRDASPADVAAIDAQLEGPLAELSARGAQLPTHMLAKRYLLSQLDYLVLLLAIDNGLAAAGAHRVSHVASVALEGLEPVDVDAVFQRLTVVAERLVVLSDDDDPVVVATQSVRELLGL